MADVLAACVTHRPSHELIRSLERKRVAAMGALDVATLEALLHADLLFGHADGHADDKLFVLF